jgi:hypothetical protein
MAWMNSIKDDDANAGSSGSQKNPDRKPSARTLLGLVVLMIACGSVFGYALFRAQSIQNPVEKNTSIVSAETQANCQELVDRAMQASGDYCNQIGSNQVCYGNNTLTAELVTSAASRFSQRGDIISVANLRRLAASPLSLASSEWGIAVFKVMANLPRSLPGETITMVVFGNTALDNLSNNLQTFYFSSTLGQIQCDQVPFDGLMITMPNGAGVSFVINGAEMTLMGNASLKATKNGTMDVSMFSGSALITSNGHTQLVTAGQKTSMGLGGPDGTSAVSPPSVPQSLSAEELAVACTMTGQFCSSQQITPVNGGDALATLQSGLGLNSTSAGDATSPPGSTASLTIMPSPTIGPNPTRTRPPSSNSTATLILNTIPPSLTNTLPLIATNTPIQPTNTPFSPTNTSPPPATNTPQPPTAIPMITICHCPQADKIGCSMKTIPNDGSSGHLNHPYDIIPAPAGGCP